MIRSEISTARFINTWKTSVYERGIPNSFVFP